MRELVMYDAAYDRAFDRFEYLAALVHLDFVRKMPGCGPRSDDSAGDGSRKRSHGKLYLRGPNGALSRLACSEAHSDGFMT